MPETIRIDVSKGVARVTLSRPEVRNAFDGRMLTELRETFSGFASDDSVRVVVLTGEGKAF